MTQLEALQSIEAFLDAFDHCHDCGEQLVPDEIMPTHCEGCCYDCDDHDEPACTPMYVLHGEARTALKELAKLGSLRPVHRGLSPAVEKLDGKDLRESIDSHRRVRPWS
jgi:hypothetical protein